MYSTQQTQKAVIIIDSASKPQVTDDLLDIIAELKNILQDSIKALSPEENQP
jgi:hypothetical protein